MRRYNKGWRFDSFRHGLSAKGIKNKPFRTILAPPLQSANVLPVQVSIIVPSTNKEQEYIGDEAFAKRVKEEKEWFDKKFEGDTKIDSVGSWWSTDRNESVTEKGAVVQSSMSVAKYNRFREEIAGHAEEKRKAWEQQSVYVQVEGNAFITPKSEGSDDDTGQSEQIIVS